MGSTDYVDGGNFHQPQVCFLKEIQSNKDGHSKNTVLIICFCICNSLLLYIQRERERGFFFWLHHVACGILVPQPGIKPMPPAVGKEES